MGTRERIMVACLLNAEFIELWIQIKAQLRWIKFYRYRNNAALRKSIIVKLCRLISLIEFFTIKLHNVSWQDNTEVCNKHVKFYGIWR